MSQENVEVVQAFFAAWNERDSHALRELHHPDAIMRAPEGWPEPGPFVGRDAVMRQFEQVRSTYDAETIELISAFSHIADRVVVRLIWHAVGQGPESNIEWTVAFVVRQGTIRFVEYFWDHAEALEAVGLAE
jgi:ketosteroid isomerase-like protein